MKRAIKWVIGTVILGGVSYVVCKAYNDLDDRITENEIEVEYLKDELDNILEAVLAGEDLSDEKMQMMEETFEEEDGE